MSRYGKRLIEAANEAVAIAREELSPARVHVSAEVDVKAIRQKTKLSQEDFASIYGFTIHQIRDWEQGRSRPIAGLRAYLKIIDHDPAGVLRLLHDAA